MNKLIDNINKILYYIKKYGIKKFIKKILKSLMKKKSVEKDDNEINYQNWIKNNEPNEEELEKQRSHKFKYEPKISIIVPMYNTKETFFKDLIDCMNLQTYLNWELCLADGSEQTDKNLEKYYKNNKKIKYKKLEKNGGISENTNEGLKLATGEYIGLLDHDDILPIFCLYEIVKCINENPDVEFIYTDEDKIMGEWKNENRNGAFFKPDFSPNTLSCNNYITHFVVMKKELMIDKLKGFRDKYNGAQDFDLVLRASEETKKIYHIPKILYHWRIHQESTAMLSEAKPWAYDAGRLAVEDHIKRLGLEGKVEHGGDVAGIYKINYKLNEDSKINILIVHRTDNEIAFLSNCIESIVKNTEFKNYEIDVIGLNETEKEKINIEEFKDCIKDEKIKFIKYESELNYSKMLNEGIKQTNGNLLCILDEKIEVKDKDWLENIAGYSQIKNIGVVTGKIVYYQNNTIKNTGISYGTNNYIGNILAETPDKMHGYFGRESLTQDVSCVSKDCMCIKRTVLNEIGMFDEDNFSIAFYDLDLCLRLRTKEYYNIYNPYSVLYYNGIHDEGYNITRKLQNKFIKEEKIFENKWKDILSKNDPFYNKNFSKRNANYVINPNKVE